MESPAIWVSFLRVLKSPKRENGGYVGFFGGDGSPCNIGNFQVPVIALKNQSVIAQFQLRDWPPFGKTTCTLKFNKIKLNSPCDVNVKELITRKNNVEVQCFVTNHTQIWLCFFMHHIYYISSSNNIHAHDFNWKSKWNLFISCLWLIELDLINH